MDDTSKINNNNNNKQHIKMKEKIRKECKNEEERY